MAKLLEIENAPGYFLFFCPGCECGHQINLRNDGRGWEWNESMESPTFTPSYKTWLDHGPNQFNCHSYIRDGRIEFLSDSTHTLAGQTVELPDWDSI